MPQPTEETRRQLELAVRDFENAARIPAKRRQVKINGVVDRLCAKAYEVGFDEDLIDDLVSILTGPHHLDQSTAVMIVRHLYPRERVSESSVQKAVCGLGHGEEKMPLAVQGVVLKWLIMVYDFLVEPKTLSHLYSVIFNLIHTSVTRAPACHLLSLITRRKHVRPFRIQILLELSRQIGSEPAIVGLLRIYKDYYPDVIVGSVGSGRASVFTHPDPEWRTHLNSIQEASFHDKQYRLEAGERTFRVARQGINGLRWTKSLPQVHTSRAQEDSVTLEEIENVTDFVDRLEKIELPNQLVAVVGDPLLQKLLQLKAEPAISRRVENWLAAFFEDQLAESTSNGTLLEMMGSIHEYARYTKTLPEACINYLKSIMETWDGITGRDVIVSLLTYLPLESFEKLRIELLQPAEFAILDGSIEAQIVVLELYTGLLQQWTNKALSTDLASESVSSTIDALVSHGNSLALTILQTTPLTLASRYFQPVLDFYERTVYLMTSKTLHHHVRIAIPHAELVYTLFFSSSLTVVSRICAILTQYKLAFEMAMTSSGAETSHSQLVYLKDDIDQFNGFLMDICNCIWRSKAFNYQDPNASGCLLPPGLVRPLSVYLTELGNGLALSSLFTLSYSPVLCLASITFFRGREDEEISRLTMRHAGPITQTSLAELGRDGGLIMTWANYRLDVLRWLEGNQVNGISELMFNTLRHLMEARKHQDGNR